MLLFDRQPLILDKHLAKAIGLNEAIVLQQVHYWLEINKKGNRNLHEGRYWTYNTIEEWQEEFIFWSKDTVRRTFKRLRELGFIIVDQYNTYKMDKTLWYTIDYDKLNNMVDNSLEPNSSDKSDCQSQDLQNATMETSDLLQAIPEISTENSTKMYNPSVSLEKSNYIDQKELSKNKIDIQTEYESIIEKCELGSIDEKYNNAVAFAIKLLLLDMEKSSTVKIGQHNYPSKSIRQDLRKLNFFVIEHAVNKFKQASESYEIKNVIQYLKSCIYNAIHEVDIELDAKLRNAGYD